MGASNASPDCDAHLKFGRPKVGEGVQFETPRETRQQFLDLRADAQDRLDMGELRYWQFLQLLLDVYALHLEQPGQGGGRDD